MEALEVTLELLVLGLLATAAYIDSKTQRIPNQLNLSLLVCGLLSCFIMHQVTPLSHLIGLFCVSVPMLGIALLFPGAFGMGDVKLMGACGLFLGWERILVAALIGIIIGGVQGVYYLLFKKKGRKERFAFGPALCIGIVVAMFGGFAVFDSFLGFS